MNSWCGMQTRLNPLCSIGGRQAVIEAYARERLLEVNYKSLQSIVTEFIKKFYSAPTKYEIKNVQNSET